jgi:membrane fusion protein (multidrug efflux system)
MIALAVLVGLLVTGQPAAMAQVKAKVKVVAVEAVTIKSSRLVESVSAIGTLKSNEAVMIRSEINGRIVEIGFDEGQPVKKGTVLFRLDNTIFRAELAEVEARQLLSQRNYERAKALEGRGHGSVETLDRALAQRRVDQASVNLVRARMEKSIIHAPFDGIVGLRRISVGDYVKAGNDLVNLENIDRIKVDFRLPERYMRVVRTEGAIRITPDALPGEAFDGRIYAIDPQIDPAVRSIAVRALLSNAGRVLRPGMFVRISLIIDRAQKALVVPEEAIVRRGNQQFVFRILKGSAILTPVKLGLRETGRVEVVEGLSVGDTLVTAGHAKLREGSRVDVTRWHDAKS